MYIPSPQTILTAGLGYMAALSDIASVIEGKCQDYSVEKCIDDDGKVRCSKPFLASESTCYKIEWSTDGVLAHTTAEVRDAGSDDIVFYRDFDGEWTPEKTELVYLDFKPKVPGQEDREVRYVVTKCK